MTSTSNPETPARPELPKELLWLSDAPLFIDAAQVSSFYDAVVAPIFRKVKVIDTRGKEVRLGVAGKVVSEVKMTLGQLLALLAPFFGFEGKVGGEASVSRDRTDKEQFTEELMSIDTPQRQLLLLTLHYIQMQPPGGVCRAYLVRDPSQEVWRMPEYIRAVPRSLIFLELPGLSDAASPLVPTMLIPTAAEIEGKGVVELYPDIPGAKEAGTYPEAEPDESAEKLRDRRRKYWSAFREHFSPTKAMMAVEKATGVGRMRWIDYRLPITDRGDTLHLHCCPGGHYDTGVFAYNMIKRGFKHGLRLVGTLKSEPDLNVLAVYER